MGEITTLIEALTRSIAVVTNSGMANALSTRSPTGASKVIWHASRVWLHQLHALGLEGSLDADAMGARIFPPIGNRHAGEVFTFDANLRYPRKSLKKDSGLGTNRVGS